MLAIHVKTEKSHTTTVAAPISPHSNELLAPLLSVHNYVASQQGYLTRIVYTAHCSPGQLVMLIYYLKLSEDRQNVIRNIRKSSVTIVTPDLM